MYDLIAVTSRISFENCVIWKQTNNKCEKYWSISTNPSVNKSKYFLVAVLHLHCIGLHCIIFIQIIFPNFLASTFNMDLPPKRYIRNSRNIAVVKLVLVVVPPTRNENTF